MKPTCQHLAGLGPIPPGRDVCEACIEQGGTWVHLRQCLICGKSLCCDSSPNRHASRHAREADHPLMRSLEEGEDWTWCFADEVTLRQSTDGEWQEVDTYLEAGLWYAHDVAERTGTFAPTPDEVTPGGFPLGAWAQEYRARRRAGTLDPEQAEALEAVPGWQW
jgi:ubiquitin-hydrolase Zn-finger-containing protein/helicase associated protein